MGKEKTNALRCAVKEFYQSLKGHTNTHPSVMDMLMVCADGTIDMIREEEANVACLHFWRVAQLAAAQKAVENY